MLKGSRKKQKTGDKAYRPGNPRKKPVDTSNFSTENLLKLMNCAASPAKKAVLLDTTTNRVQFESDQLFTPSKKRYTTLVSPSKCLLSTPEKGPLTTFVTTPKGSKLLPSRIIDCDDGAMALFISEDKVKGTLLTLPASPTLWKSPIPKADMKGMIDVKITKQRIIETESLVRKRKRDGLNPRGKSQNQIMGIPATQAMRLAGIDAPDGTGQHAHFIPFGFIADKGQCVANLGIGTRFANAAMELVNPAIKKLLFKKKNTLPAVYLSAIPEWVPGFEHIRLLKSITYIIKDAPGKNFKRSASVKFNMLSMESVCLTDVLPIRKFIINKFSTKPSPQAKSPLATAKMKNNENNDDFLHRSPSLTLSFKQRLRELDASPLSPMKPAETSMHRSSAKLRTFINN